MLIKVNTCITNIILISNIISIVLGDCFLEFNKDRSLRPTILTKIGSQFINLPLEDDIRIRLFESQEIVAYCKSKFARPEENNIKNEVKLKCTYGYITSNNGRYSNGMTLECSSQKWNLFETNSNFVWCPMNVTSYLLARPKELLTGYYEYLAGICYDTQNLSLKSVYYTIAPNPNNVLHPAVLFNSYKPGLELKYIKETFTKKSINEQHYDHPVISDWIKFAQYNFTSIIQNSILLDEFNHELGSILDLAWWPSLRLGNWKRYERALTTHIVEKHQIYDIVAGISSKAKVPIIDTCNNNLSMTELEDTGKHEIPMYVWNYLRSPSNSSDEIVVIGFNSPFYEFYSEKDVIFCPDKCQEISWLKKPSTTFRYNALGVMFCCTVEDVKSSKRLDGFPEVNMDSKPEIVIESEELNTLASTHYSDDYDNERLYN